MSEDKPFFICVDFDATICDHEDIVPYRPRIGKPIPGAVEALLSFQELGANIILYTIRSNFLNGLNQINIAEKYLWDNGIRLYAVNNNPSQKSWSDSRKVYADVYIDDRNIGCPMTYSDGFARPYVDWSIVRHTVEFMIKNRQ